MSIGRVGGSRKDVEEGLKWVIQIEVSFLDFRPQLLKYPGGTGGDLGDLRVDGGVPVVGGPRDAHTLDPATQSGAEVRRRLLDGIGVPAVWPCQDLQEQGGIGHGAAHGTGLREVVGGRASIATVTRDAVLGGLYAEDAAESGRNADGAAAVASSGNGAEPGGKGRARAAAGAAGGCVRCSRDCGWDR